MVNVFKVIVDDVEFGLSEYQLFCREPHNIFAEQLRKSAVVREFRKVHVQRRPEVFAFILKYLSGEFIFPISEEAAKSVNLSAKALVEHILEDAKCYQMPNLVNLAKAELKVIQAAEKVTHSATQSSENEIYKLEESRLRYKLEYRQLEADFKLKQAEKEASIQRSTAEQEAAAQIAIVCARRETALFNLISARNRRKKNFWSHFKRSQAAERVFLPSRCFHSMSCTCSDAKTGLPEHAEAPEAFTATIPKSRPDYHAEAPAFPAESIANEGHLPILATPTEPAVQSGTLLGGFSSHKSRLARSPVPPGCHYPCPPVDYEMEQIAVDYAKVYTAGLAEGQARANPATTHFESTMGPSEEQRTAAPPAFAGQGQTPPIHRHMNSAAGERGGFGGQYTDSPMQHENYEWNDIPVDGPPSQAQPSGEQHLGDNNPHHYGEGHHDQQTHGLNRGRRRPVEAQSSTRIATELVDVSVQTDPVDPEIASLPSHVMDAEGKDWLHKELYAQVERAYSMLQEMHVSDEGKSDENRQSKFLAVVTDTMKLFTEAQARNHHE